MADPGVSDGWQHRKSSSNVSSFSSGTSMGAASGRTSAASRARRDSSLRHWSIIRRLAVRTSQAVGCSGTPSFGQRVAAASQRLLDGVLGRIEVAVAAHDGAEDPRRQLAQQVLESLTPASVRPAHRLQPLGHLGRRSTAMTPSTAAPGSAARSGCHQDRARPRSCRRSRGRAPRTRRPRSGSPPAHSLNSWNGPSVTTGAPLPFEVTTLARSGPSQDRRLDQFATGAELAVQRPVVVEVRLHLLRLPLLHGRIHHAALEVDDQDELAHWSPRFGLRRSALYPENGAEQPFSTSSVAE